MSYSREDYFAEGLGESLEEHGVVATSEQIKAIARDVVLFAENIGQAFYSPEDPRAREADSLRKELEKEREKVVCRVCQGTGNTVSHGPHHSAYSSCWRCNGAGRHAP
ncbi:hypothetical protein Q087_01772 [Pseudomonas aeruginosa C40]|nr:hypothetical protein Q087_01772 [Pseudomonas aeruginosa C40]